MSEQFINGYWQVDGIPSESGRHHEQPRELNNFIIFNSRTPQTDCKITAYEKTTGNQFHADFFGGKNTYQIVNGIILLVSRWFQGHYIGRGRDLVAAAFNTNTKSWIPAAFPLKTPQVQQYCFWMKVGSGQDISPQVPNDPGGNVVFPSITFVGPGLVEWETETLTSLGALSATQRWRRQINLTDGTMGPIQNV